jgi:ABC-2 type transport system ATP-binding protein
MSLRRFRLPSSLLLRIYLVGIAQFVLIVTVVFSTHDMSTAERLCDRIFMIYKGNTVLDGTLEEVQSRYGHDTVRVRCGGGPATLARFNSIIDSVNDHGNYQDLRLKGDPQQLLTELVRSGPVYHFEVTKPSLHDIFVRIANPAADELHAMGASR